MVWYNNTQINKLCISIHFNIFSKGERIMSNSACTVDKKKLITQILIDNYNPKIHTLEVENFIQKICIRFICESTSTKRV